MQCKAIVHMSDACVVRRNTNWLAGWSALLLAVAMTTTGLSIAIPTSTQKQC